MTTLVRALARPAHWYANRGLRTKLKLLLAAVCAATLAIGIVAFSAVSAMHSTARSVYSDNVSKVTLALKLQGVATTMNNDLFLLGNSNQAIDITNALHSVHSDDRQFASLLQQLTTSAAGRYKALLSKSQADYGAFADVRDKKLVPLAKSQAVDSFLLVLKGEAETDFAALDRDLQTLEQQVNATAASAVQRSENTYSTERWLLAGVLVFALAFVIAAMTYVGRSLVRPILKVRGVLQAVAEGDLTQRVDIHTKDEVGSMAEALDAATQSMRDTVRALAESATKLHLSSSDLSHVSEQISGSAQETAQQAGVVAAAVNQVDRSVQAVAASSRQVGVSITEIAQHAVDAARVGTHAVQVTDDANRTVGELDASSQEIGEVIALINGIAKQTHLLALNATIEAARAGSAGRGFSVVAHEVKELARRTAQATEGIAERIGAIRAGTTTASDSIGEVGEIIGRINDLQTTIASAVEEQTAATRGVSQSLSRAAEGSTQIAENIAAVADAAAATTRGVDEAHRAAEELRSMSLELAERVGQFHYE